MLHLIDRRPNGRGKSAVNRERFLRRYKAQIETAVKKMVGERRLADMEQGGEVRVPRKDISEPSFGFGRGGDREFVLPGNREYVAGDRFRGRTARAAAAATAAAAARAAATTSSCSRCRARSSCRSSSTTSSSRISRAPKWGTPSARRACGPASPRPACPPISRVIRTLRNRSRAASRSRGGIDARGRSGRGGVRARGRGGPCGAGRGVARRARAAARGAAAGCRSSTTSTCAIATASGKPEPIARAVMFCLMDVSASMDEDKKDLAKRFFTLLYLFLTRKYGEVDLIFIRHTDDAEEVDEDTFFHDTRSGGTVVYSALELADKIRARALRERLERLCGAGLRRRRLRRRPGAQRAVPPRAAAAGHALLHLPRARRAGHAGPFVDAVGRVRARRRGERAISRCAMRRAARRSIRSSASCSRRRRNDRGVADERSISHGADWDFELLERYDAAIAEVAARVSASTPIPNQIEIITSEQMLDAYATSGLARRLSALVVRQGVHPQRAGVPARHAGARLRDRHQFQSVHRVPDGGEHDDDAGARHRACLLRSQFLLQGQPSVPAVDRRRRHPRLPGVRPRAT